MQGIKLLVSECDATFHTFAGIMCVNNSLYAISVYIVAIQTISELKWWYPEEESTDRDEYLQHNVYAELKKIETETVGREVLGGFWGSQLHCQASHDCITWGQ